MTDHPVTDHYRGRKVLIAGGLGFVGSNLARHLVTAGADVLIVDSLHAGLGGNLFNVVDIRDQVRVDKADIRDEPAMRALVRGHDYVFNLAAQVSHTGSMQDPYTDLEINARGALSLLEACRHENPEVTIVFASTRQIYGRPEYLPVDERHPVRPTDINGVHKMAGELYHRVYHTAYGLKTVSLRLTNTYGPRMHVRDARQTFVGWWVRQIVEGQALQIFGDGRQVRDFNYVDDVVEALLLAATSDAAVGEAFNLGSADSTSLLDLAKLMVELNGGGECEIVAFPDRRKRIDIGDFHGDFRKAHNELGWQPRVSLRGGLLRTLEYYKEHLQHYV
ncbi:MAG: GDP-mannose 4,6-dehydratase [Gemmatimonadota bacterium]|jgi:nucleoside-diphosphate-sugar epimerase|nr:GDP-mannose 4,6-dehydratase [Gemmatimonadota bacterium]